MRKIIFFMAFALCALCVQAQEFNSDYKYKNVFSNVSIGASASYNRAVFGNNSQNVGMDLRLTKRIHDNFRIRAIADVNGVSPNGFDRYGKAMLGASLDFMPFYMFFDYGANYNPSYKSSKFGAAADAGIGLSWDYFHIEAGADMANNGTLWQSNAFAKIGVDIPFALPEKERVAMSIDNTIHQEYGNLKKENKELKDEIVSINETQRQLQDIINQSQKLLATMEEKLIKCEEINKESTQIKNHEDLMEVYFDYAESQLSQIEEQRLIKFAEYIIQDGGNFIIEGYCSANGDPYKNEVLSKRRAEYVYDILVAYDVPKFKISWVGNGMTDIDDYLEQKVIIKKVN